MPVASTVSPAMLRESLFLFVLLLGVSQANIFMPRGYRPSLTNKVTSVDDFLMDMVLDELKFYLRMNNETVIDIPPISTSFEYDLIGIPFRGAFNTSKGSFTNPATVERQGDVSVTHTKGRINIATTLTFSQLEVWFDQYTASVIGISESGGIDVNIQSNAVYVEIAVMWLPHCVVSITHLELIKMSSIMVNMTGLGVLSSLEGQIIGWVLQSYKTSFQDIVEGVVRAKLQEELAKTRICKFKSGH